MFRSRSGMRIKLLALLQVFAMALAVVLPAGNVFGLTQNQARALARSKGLESLRTVITADAAIGLPLLLNPGKVPLPENLNAFLNPKNMNARKVAAQLGKALFWDMAVGSDGQSCASCHFHAGADNRIKNQLSPDITRVKNDRQGDVKGFHFAAGAADFKFQLGGPNYTLQANDFPFIKDIGAGDLNGRNVVINGLIIKPAMGNTNDVVSSQGVFFTAFQSIDPNIYNPFALGSDPVKIRDKGEPIIDPAGFLVAADNGAFGGKVNVRRVEPRNTPTMINAVFNLHNFWDGRANFHFNGVNPFGRTDREARIFTRGNNGKLATRNIEMKFASLASQAVGPPLSNFEMSFDGRNWPDIGKKMVGRVLLESQTVAGDDSLLGALRTQKGAAANGKGIKVKYEQLIKEAFNPNLWDSSDRIFFPGAAVNEIAPNSPLQIMGEPTILSGAQALQATTLSFSQMEANFSFFFGVAVMLYEAELVADQSKFDKFMEGKVSLTNKEKLGLEVFVGKGRCINCHGGPEFSNATVRNTQAGGNLIEPMLMGDQKPAFYDNGFYNIGVTPTVEDLGRGGKGPEEKPLASSRQFLFADNSINGPINFPIIGLPVKELQPDGPVFVAGICQQPILRTVVGAIDVCKDLNCDGVCDLKDEILLQRVAVDGAFKTPQLRNVELTGPYWHNGALLTLMQVVEFYDDGGNFCKFNIADLDPDIEELGLNDVEREGLVSFLIALTDNRVKMKKAPFDHPELRIPNGHPGNQNGTAADGDFHNKQAKDAPLIIPAVGKNGVTAGMGLKPFHDVFGLTHFDITTPVVNVPCKRPNSSTP
jgi:cytochrome c peroxidase